MSPLGPPAPSPCLSAGPAGGGGSGSHTGVDHGSLAGVDRGALLRIVEPIALAHGAEIVDLECRSEREGWVVRVYVERRGAAELLLSTRDAAVALGLCADISRDLGPALDVAELIPHAYHLEVSSPGLERTLRHEVDFVRFKGQKAKIKLRRPLGPPSGVPAADPDPSGSRVHSAHSDVHASGAGAAVAPTPPGRRNVVGILCGIFDGCVRVQDGARNLDIPLPDIERAHLVFEIERQSSPSRARSWGGGEKRARRSKH